VGDAAEALLKMAGYDGEHRIFNVSTGKGTSVVDLVRNLERLIGRELRIEVDSTKVRRIERMSLVLDNSLIGRELNWTPAISLEEGLRRTLAAERGDAKNVARI
jgi:UDP-glucose 4-epimerase